MQKFEKLMLPITFILIVILGWIFLGNRDIPKNENTNEQLSENKVPIFTTKSGEMGAVMVEVTPVSPAKYSLKFNTHSVDLDFDFKNIIKLEDNNGKEYEAVSWSGGRGGHHLNGELLFSTIDPNAESIKISITGIEEEVLSFDWSVK